MQNVKTENIRNVLLLSHTGTGKTSLAEAMLFNAKAITRTGKVEDGNTVTECPDGYTLVQTASGPMCQKSVTSTRQRAGASTRAYTGLAGNVGRRGPGQRRKTVTSTRRVRPTIRSA